MQRRCSSDRSGRVMRCDTDTDDLRHSEVGLAWGVEAARDWWDRNLPSPIETMEIMGVTPEVVASAEDDAPGEGALASSSAP